MELNQLAGQKSATFCRNDEASKAEIKDGARGRNRTGTDITVRGILSPLRLPVPPPGRDKSFQLYQFEWPGTMYVHKDT